MFVLGSGFRHTKSDWSHLISSYKPKFTELITLKSHNKAKQSMCIPTFIKRKILNLKQPLER